MHDAEAVAPVIERRGMSVGGEWVTPSRAATIRLADPATEEVFASVPRGGAPDARAAVHAARWAFDEGGWPALSPAERAVALRRFAVECALGRDRLEEIARRESGATTPEAVARLVHAPLDAIAWYAERAARDPETRLPDHPGPPPASSLLVREPAGVVAVLAAAAEPLAALAHLAVAALAAGNTVVVKAASGAPLAAFELADAAARAGLPPGVLNVVSGPGRDAGAELCANPLVDLVAFAGGRHAAAKTGARVALCGASGVAVALRDADVSAAAPAIAAEWLAHNGQAWGAACRLVADAAVHDDLLDALVHHVKGLAAVAPLRSRPARERARRILSSLLDEGASLAAGGGAPDGPGFFLDPAILAGVDERSRTRGEEIAAPILLVYRADGDDDVIRIANEQGAGGVLAHVVAGTREEALDAARRLRFATVRANGAGANPWGTFGGYGRAGRAGGLPGIDAFSEIKHIATPPS